MVPLAVIKNSKNALLCSFLVFNLKYMCLMMKLSFGFWTEWKALCLSVLMVREGAAQTDSIYLSMVDPVIQQR